MTTDQIDYLNMANASLGILHENDSIWTGNTTFSGQVTAIEEDVDTIEMLSGTQATSAKGATISEYAAWQAAAEIAEHVDAGIKAYYMHEDDMVKYEIVNFSNSDFEYGKLAVVLERMKKVHEMAVTIPILDLADFNIVAADLTKLDAAITTFEESIPVHTEMVSVTSSATAELPVVFTSLRKKFKKMDLMVLTYKMSKPIFVDNYFKARNILDYGKTHVTAEVDLLPKEFKALFDGKLKIGYWMTVRNHSDFNALIYLTDKTDTLDIANEVEIPAQGEYKLAIPGDFKNVFNHWLMVYNPNTLDKVKLTIILSKNKSQSKAPEKPNIAE